MQIFTAVLVVVFGGLTVWFDDEAFFKMKTTSSTAFFAISSASGFCAAKAGCNSSWAR